MRDRDHQRPTSVAARLRGQFAPAYLTLTSIIQGVALSTLVIRVEGMSEHFGVANWLLATATLLAFLLVWHEYLMQALTYVWMPTLVDSAVPFGILVAELFLAHFVYGNERVWFLIAGLAFVFGIVAWGTTRAHTQENAELLKAVRGVSPMRTLPSVVSIVLFLGIWALYDVLGLGRISGLVAAIAVLVIVGVLATTVPYWNRVLAYARREEASEDASNEDR
ncbi:MAG TPA: hypothetical protein VH591_01290 [Ktedonobacterales bacterium]|jgi:hypothetical protein